MNNKKLSGVYLVIDPSMDQSELFDRVKQALEGGVSVLQIWNNWPENMHQPDKEQFASYIVEMARDYDVPVLINDDWELLKPVPLDGVHFDSVPDNWEHIRQEIGRDFIAGITCSNDLDVVRWADENAFDYISFCAMFPSPSVGSCEIVKPETVRKAREITDIPLFLSGGITPEKIGNLEGLNFNGVAVISGILKNENPQKQAKKYNKMLNVR